MDLKLFSLEAGVVSGLFLFVPTLSEVQLKTALRMRKIL